MAVYVCCLQVEGLLDKLCTAALPHVPSLPLTSQATLALALAQLEYYDPPLVNALVEAVKVTLSTPQQQQQAAASSDGSSGSNGSSSGGSNGGSSGSSGVIKAAALAELPEGLVSGVLLSVAVACSLIGHYDAELLDSVAQQVCSGGFVVGDHAPNRFPHTCCRILIFFPLCWSPHLHCICTA